MGPFLRTCWLQHASHVAGAAVLVDRDEDDVEVEVGALAPSVVCVQSHGLSEDEEHELLLHFFFLVVDDEEEDEEDVVAAVVVVPQGMLSVYTVGPRFVSTAHRLIGSHEVDADDMAVASQQSSFVAANVEVPALPPAPQQPAPAGAKTSTHPFELTTRVWLSAHAPLPALSGNGDTSGTGSLVRGIKVMGGAGGGL
jgi:hypothetical protein